MRQLMRTAVNLNQVITETGQLKYFHDDGYVDMAITQSGGLPVQIMLIPTISQAVAEISRARSYKPVNVMLNWVKPNSPVPKHRDWVRGTKQQPEKPTLERWHLPIQTSVNCFWWDELDGRYHMPLGMWCGPVPYWVHHTVYNEGSEPRLHIIVDLDSPPLGRYAENGGLVTHASSLLNAEAR